MSKPSKQAAKGYYAKTTVYLHIVSDYADGVGEAQREVRAIIASLQKDNPEIKIAHATEIDVNVPGVLKQKMTECDLGLFQTLPNGKKVVLDSGDR